MAPVTELTGSEALVRFGLLKIMDEVKPLAERGANDHQVLEGSQEELK